MLKVRGLAPLVGALVVVASAIALFGFSSTLNPIDALLGRGRVVTVPDVVGRALPRARAETTELGLVVSTRTAFSLSEPRGTVIGQDPAAGDRARAGDPIELIVSNGANRVEMPDAVGRPVAEVTPVLETAGVPVRISEVMSETIAKGLVISQAPAPGVQVTGEDVAELEVSAGPENRPVPEVVGLSIAGAGFRLGEAGLLIGAVTRADDPAVVAGAVIAVDPPVGTVVAKDTPVAVVLSNGGAAVPVPDVTNTQEGPATTTLEAAGFVVDVAGRLVTFGDPGKGNVFEQSPPAGDSLRPGDVVTIVVGREPPPPRTTTTTTTTIKPTTTTVKPTTTTRRGGG